MAKRPAASQPKPPLPGTGGSYRFVDGKWAPAAKSAPAPAEPATPAQDKDKD